MKVFVLLLSVCVFSAIMVTAPAVSDATVPAITASSMIASAPALFARAGSKIELMVINEVTTKTAKPGDRFLLRLAQPFVIGDRVVIPRGVAAWGEVTDVETNGIAGRSGKLATRLLYIEFAGQKLALSGTPGNAGQGGNLQIVLATLALTPWGLVAKGNNAKLKAGDIVPGYIVNAFPAPIAAATTP
jgi:hypothetical protein